MRKEAWDGATDNFCIRGNPFVHKEYEDFIEKLKSSSDTDKALSRAVKIVTRQYGVCVPDAYIFRTNARDYQRTYLEECQWLRRSDSTHMNET